VRQWNSVAPVQSSLANAVLAPPPRAPPGYSAPGYELFPGVGYYKFHTAAKTWDEARQICQQEGGHLVVINSEAESQVLQRLFDAEKSVPGTNHNNYAFVGFHDRFVEGEHLTVFGMAPPSSLFSTPDTQHLTSFMLHSFNISAFLLLVLYVQANSVALSPQANYTD
jgi:hypothetical protein